MTTPNLERMRRLSYLEWTLWHQMEQAEIWMPIWQHKMDDGHKVDFCWYPVFRLVVEVQGGTWSKGAHTRGAGYAADRMRSNRYQLDGWMVLEFTSEQVLDGTALGVIAEALEQEAARVGDGWTLGEDE